MKQLFAVICIIPKQNMCKGTFTKKSQPNIGIRNGELCAASITDKTVIGFKYFDFQKPKQLVVTTCGSSGILEVHLSLSDTALAEIPVKKSDNWIETQVSLPVVKGIYPLRFIYQGNGKINFLKFKFI